MNPAQDSQCPGPFVFFSWSKTSFVGLYTSSFLGILKIGLRKVSSAFSKCRFCERKINVIYRYSVLNSHFLSPYFNLSICLVATNFENWVTTNLFVYHSRNLYIQCRSDRIQRLKVRIGLIYGCMVTIGYPSHSVENIVAGVTFQFWAIFINFG